MTLVAMMLWAASASAQTFDLVEEDIVADVRGTSLIVSARATVEVDADTSTLWIANFAVAPREIRVGGEPVPTAPHPEAPGYVIVATLPAMVSAGTRLLVEADLEGPPRCSVAGRPGATCFHSASETILMMAGGGDAWFLSDIYGIDAFTGTITVRAPAGHVIRAGQGVPIEETMLPDGSQEVRYRIEAPTSLVPLYAGAAEVASADGAEVIHHADRDDAAKVQEVADLASDVSAFLGAHYDRPAPEPVRIVLVPRTFVAGGMGLLGNVFMGEYIAGDLDYLLRQGVAHELAHTWWGGFASIRGIEESGFFQEAFAEYSAWLTLGELGDEDVRMAGNRMNAVWYMYGRPGDRDVAILDPLAYQSEVYVHAIYHKGSLVLRALEHEFGRDAMTAVLRALIAAGPGTLGEESFREALRTGGFAGVDRFFSEWLETTGYPRIAATSTWGDGALSVVLSIDGDYTMTLPLRATFEDGTTETMSMTGLQTSWPLAERPVHVEIDPEWVYLREVSPSVAGDVNLDGEVDGADAIAVALEMGHALPDARRKDGSFDPLFDVVADRRIDRADLDAVVAAE